MIFQGWEYRLLESKAQQAAEAKRAPTTATGHRGPATHQCQHVWVRYTGEAGLNQRTQGEDKKRKKMLRKTKEMTVSRQRTVRQEGTIMIGVMRALDVK